MKIMTLNTWGGLAGRERVLDFFQRHADMDIFCLQEIWSAAYEHLDGHVAGGRELDNSKIMTNGLQDISKVLSGHTSYFRPHHEDNYGLLMLIKNNIKVLEEGERFVYREKGYKPEGDVGNHARNIQYALIESAHGPLTVINFHGLWVGNTGKRDIPERIGQSEKIAQFIQERPEPIVLAGDFNLLPDTESLAILERQGLRNLVKEYGITSTRTSYYTKPEKYADYVLVSENVSVKDFRVLPDEVSDHAPLLLEID